ncbi:hypothetical protein BCR32DRAFT_324232 [Anaeromyces robustus]|jgi:hypothetical protein|uniref:Chitin-binding type-1 domain-containing protein n=1 Tax=Anaeromyces robustus TaxID=1754192 RepID=A0A1Y1XQ44_9FUNG|nr:hypothetical protein BCR32DRAFT_324232 [Anaeromyces robustus]|eukprot:ORX87880.1 hypothetical protein BCR32DRAFT_324232 [Anaeromyces robustus]
MKRFSLIHFFSSTLLTTLFLGSKANSDYLKNVERGELFLKTDFNVAQFNMTIIQSQFDKLLESANTIYDNENLEAKVQGKLKIGINSKEIYEDGDTQFGIGGQSTRGAKKLNFNVKMDKKKLGRKNLRLRSAMFDPSFLRIKLSTDILNRIGLKSISSNFADVFINEDYMGLYVLIDAYKNSWLKEYYKLKNDPSYQFFQCKVEKCDLTENNAKLCISDSNSDELAEPPLNDDIDNQDPDKIRSENIPLLDFMKAINSKKTLNELKKIMDVDVFIKTWIFEWLIGSIDHMLVNGKNYYLFRYNNIWIPLIYDFDTTFGLDIEGQLKSRYGSKPAETLFKNWYDDRYIVDYLTQGENESLFLNALQNILDNAFNPDLLFPHIDNLKKWIDSYVKKDRTPDANGKLPGRINIKKRSLFAGDIDDYTYDDYKKNSEYTTINNAIGIKQWIKDRYKYVCRHYNVKCKSKLISFDNTTTTTSKKTTTTTTSKKTTTTTTSKKTITTTTSKKTTPTIVKKQCGSTNGSCSEGYCCSKYGWCGKTQDHCDISKGCQEKFGICQSYNSGSSTTTTKKTTTTTTTTKKTTTITTKSKTPTPTTIKKRCGGTNGSCSEGYCCSKYGWCGKEQDHCDIVKGCQKMFGICKSYNSVSSTTTTTTTTKSNIKPTNAEGKCGKDYGSCGNNECCSKSGWCGKSDKHCEISQGCQKEFGICSDNIKTTTKITTKPITTKTTKKITSTTKKNTSTNTVSTDGKCGEGHGVCSKGFCCSKLGWCGTSTEHCAISKGCQTNYGICN